MGNDSSSNVAEYRMARDDQSARDRAAMEAWYAQGRAAQAAASITTQPGVSDSSANVAEHRSDVDAQAAWAKALADANAQWQQQERSKLLGVYGEGGSLLYPLGKLSDDNAWLKPGDAPAVQRPVLGPYGPQAPGKPSESSANVAEHKAGLDKEPILGSDAPGGIPTNSSLAQVGLGSSNIAERRNRLYLQPDSVPGTMGSDSPGGVATMSDPEVQAYLKDLGAFHEKHKGATSAAPGADGAFGTSILGLNSGGNAGFPSLSSVAFPGFLHRTKNGQWTYERAGETLQATSANAMKNPEFAGELMYTMSATGAYPAAATDAVIDRLYRDPKSGHLLGHWTETDLTALHTALTQASLIQADEVPQGVVRDPLEILRDRTHQADDLVTGSIPEGPEKKGKGGGGGRGGGRGGGGSGGAAGMQVDPEQLKLLVNNVAKNELGRALTDSEVQRFVSAFQASAGEMAKLNPTGQATSFIQGDQGLRNEAAGQSAGQFIMALARFLASSTPALPKATQANG